MAERPDTPKNPPLVRDESNRGDQAGRRSETSDPRTQASGNGAGAGQPTRSTQRSVGRRASQLIIGRLQEHGRAPYQFRPDQDLSYYAKLVTTAGVKVLWGKDLERAIHAGETIPKAGDLVGARRTGREAVTLVDRKRDAQGNVVAQSEHHAHRTRWEVEKLQFLAERARRARLARDAHLDTREAVRQRPELRSAFLSLRAAEQLAAQRIANPEDRVRFLQMVREAITASVQRGEPLPDINLRQKSPAATAPSVAPISKRRRDEPTR
ncbi:hypothetical protein HNQ60_003910 [Povalibacter uvarum]|uniref:Large polyvalent protein-associated domain-containing protein n=1 Tax=Povalibacter uvarum TaxID=732238 RepID=A0A841HQJ8_9GAMM|nr:hypothetical protein [Povalibacter uvarum]MBB6095023.1 hypothetical protein [Povalibacter uvarum]